MFKSVELIGTTGWVTL